MADPLQWFGIPPPRDPEAVAAICYHAYLRVSNRRTEEFYEVYDGDLETATLSQTFPNWKTVYPQASSLSFHGRLGRLASWGTA